MFKKMIKKAMLSIGAIALAAVGMTGFAATADAADAATITFPADRGVFQRDANNVADITVKATFDGSDTLKARVESAGAAVADWVELKDEDGTYTAVIENVPRLPNTDVIPEELLDGYEDAFSSEIKGKSNFEDSDYESFGIVNEDGVFLGAWINNLRTWYSSGIRQHYLTGRSIAA